MTLDARVTSAAEASQGGCHQRSASNSGDIYCRIRAVWGPRTTPRAPAVGTSIQPASQQTPPGRHKLRYGIMFITNRRREQRGQGLVGVVPVASRLNRPSQAQNTPAQRCRPPRTLIHVSHYSPLLYTPLTGAVFSCTNS